MNIIGIDSGEFGCIVELDIPEVTCRFMPLPYREDGLLDYYKIRYNIYFAAANYIAIEKVNPNPLFGSRQHTYGKNYGIALGLLEPYPHETFTPQQWQKSIHGIKGKTDDRTAKERTAANFKRMNPDFKDRRVTKKEAEGLKDAFFIAYYCGLKNNVVMPNSFHFVKIVDES
jgi:hypothetical protein